MTPRTTLGLLAALIGCSDGSSSTAVDAGGEPDGRQACIGEFTISSPSDLAPLSACITLDGSINVEATQLTELRLPNLVTISGGLGIFINDQLSLVDMSSLERVSTLLIMGNPQLESADLRRLITAGTSLEVGESALSDLSGFGCPCADFVTIQGNPNMTALDSASPIAAHTVFVLNNASLTDIGPISADDLVVVGENSVLTAIPDWPITTLDQGFRIVGNPMLSSINGPTQLSKVGMLEIRSNPVLIDIAHFDSLDEVSSSLEITDNTQLPNCQAEALRDQLTTVGSVTLSGNDTGATCP